eukprot:m.22820 g.22820  ORF g.22820 m.22820 type:complete len:334 (+) comp4031_c0_seq1:281-1282(+)
MAMRTRTTDGPFIGDDGAVIKGFRERRTMERLGLPPGGGPAATAMVQSHHIPPSSGGGGVGSSAALPPQQVGAQMGQPSQQSPSTRSTAAAAAVVTTPGMATQGGGAGKASGGRRKRTRRAPRKNKQKSQATPYSELPWLERKRLQDEAAKADEGDVAKKRQQAMGSRNSSKRPREQPPPAPNKSSDRARMAGLPSGPHTPAAESPLAEHGAVDRLAGGADVFKDAFDTAMSTMYDDMRAWDVPSLIAAIKERDSIVDSLSTELNEYRSAGGAELVAEMQQLRGKISAQDKTIAELHAKLDASHARVKELEQRFENRSVVDIEAEEAHAFAED